LPTGAVDTVSYMERKTEGKALVHTHVSRAVRDELRAVAQANHRSIAGELRRAIHRHLANEPKES
jgi:hypothetical protein